MNKLMNRDVKRETLRLLFEDYKQWSILIKDGFADAGIYEDVEIHIRDFVETLTHYKKDLIAARSGQVSRLDMDILGNLIMALTFEMTIKEGMIEYDWLEDDEAEENYVDIEGVLEVTAYFENWKLDRITALVMTSESDETFSYNLWPDFDMPVYFNGAFGQKQESISNNFSRLLEVTN